MQVQIKKKTIAVLKAYYCTEVKRSIPASIASLKPEKDPDFELLIRSGSKKFNDRKILSAKGELIQINEAEIKESIKKVEATLSLMDQDSINSNFSRKLEVLNHWSDGLESGNITHAKREKNRILKAIDRLKNSL